jgi:hypothetical protein
MTSNSFNMLLFDIRHPSRDAIRWHDAAETASPFMGLWPWIVELHFHGLHISMPDSIGTPCELEQA